MSFSPLVKQLIDALTCLPGVGQKTAQRMALHLLERQRDGGKHLAETLEQALRDVGRCQSCRMLTEAELCALCESPRRDADVLCVVESPTDVFAIEQSGEYRGRYFVLMGHLSPIDGIGPEDIGIDTLLERVIEEGISEVILATNPTVEGEATAFYITEQIAKQGVFF
ncbi:recombination protein RecR [bacterium]|nr:recombination protein RecR [bacterium]